MGSVTKPTPIQFIAGKSHIKKRRGHKTTLSGYYACLSHDLLLMVLEADAHTCTNVRGQMISRNQACARAWFKNVKKIGQFLETNISSTAEAISFNFDM